VNGQRNWLNAHDGPGRAPRDMRADDAGLQPPREEPARPTQQPEEDYVRQPDQGEPLNEKYPPAQTVFQVVVLHRPLRCRLTGS
jgi:hypothetical protein